MNGLNYLASLKNKEFFLLGKLCDESISSTDKEKLKKELKEIRLEIKKLG